VHHASLVFIEQHGTHINYSSSSGFKIGRTKFCQGIIERKHENGTKVLIKGKHIPVLKISYRRGMHDLLSRPCIPILKVIFFLYWFRVLGFFHFHSKKTDSN
jgi:hypothetical protein